MFFKILNKLSSHTNPNVKNHDIIFHNNRYVTDPIKQSNLFANHFSSYSHEEQPIPLDYSTENEFLNRNIEFWELKRAISKTKNSTPGADNIPSIWFKNLDDASPLKILGMLQQQLDSSVLPKAWKHTIIIPIPKPNKDKTKLASYRPIALTSVFCKIFERILAHRITHFLTSQKKLKPNQHGFLPFRDNYTAIYKIYSAISEARKNKKFFVAVSLDIKSAYDSVHVDDFILKCHQVATRGLFWDEPRNFVPRSDDEDDTRAGSPFPNFHAIPKGGRLATMYDLMCNRPIHGGSSVESGFEPGTLRPQSRDLTTRTQRPQAK
ncbi:hypothetical protein AVEN_20500-1 [Araneus ventricosus]|uniref:Reverse transcriptase domain-containing protein n=1 Tax=Araneus ventricosus TaxID=182803 RepID=A0A4Y2HZ37_ARAVE|nr:hypothetical protein AVEN_20500-1 [Araneus ventricosus]